MSTGYQSEGYKDLNQNKNYEPQEDVDISKTDPPRLQGFGSSAPDDEIPYQTISLQNIFNPKLEKFQGIALVRFFYWVGFVLTILFIVMTLILSLIGAFSYHLGFGLFALFFYSFISVVSFIFSIITLRISVEIIISIFVIRQRVTKISEK